MKQRQLVKQHSSTSASAECPGMGVCSSTLDAKLLRMAASSQSVSTCTSTRFWMMEVTEDGTSQGKRGRKSAIPPDVLEFIDAHAGHENTTIPVLQLVRQRYAQQIRAVGPEENFVTDAQIKNRCNNMKSSLKAKLVI